MRALPEYDVDVAGSYREALDLLRDGTPYDVAIVDLNLISPSVVDQLGRKFLRLLRDYNPSTPRIAVTGAPPGAVGSLVTDYGLTELFLKQVMTLAEMREGVDKALQSVAGDLSLDLREARGDRWDEFATWRQSMRHRIDRKTKNPDAEPRNAAHEASREAFESDCAGVAATLANVRNKADLDAAVREYTALRDRYHGVF
jgi:CheY-like chemotaxis protein